MNQLFKCFYIIKVEIKILILELFLEWFIGNHMKDSQKFPYSRFNYLSLKLEKILNIYILFIFLKLYIYTYPFDILKWIYLPNIGLHLISNDEIFLEAIFVTSIT
jgi:hypothetical protein